MFWQRKRQKFSERYYLVMNIKTGMSQLRELVKQEEFDDKMIARFRTVEGILESLRMEFATR